MDFFPYLKELCLRLSSIPSHASQIINFLSQYRIENQSTLCVKLEIKLKLKSGCYLEANVKCQRFDMINCLQIRD